MAHPDIYKFIKSLESEQAWRKMICRAAFIGGGYYCAKKE